MEQLGTVRPAALWIALLAVYYWSEHCEGTLMHKQLVIFKVKVLVYKVYTPSDMVVIAGKTS